MLGGSIGQGSQTPCTIRRVAASKAHANARRSATALGNTTPLQHDDGPSPSQGGP